jgi:hypothetical protein
MGVNMWGKIPDRDYENYVRELEARLAQLEKMPRRRKLKKWDFSGVVGNVNPKEYPWEM